MDRRLPLLAYLGVNALVCVALYAMHLAHLSDYGSSAPSLGVDVAFLSYVVAFLSLAALLFWGIGALAEWVAIALAPILVVAIYIDTRVYEMLGVHTYSWVAVQALMNPGVGRELSISAGTWATFAVLCAVVAVAEAFLLRWCRRRFGGYGRRQAWKASGLVAGVALLGVVTSALAWPRPAPMADRFIIDAMPCFRLLLGNRGFDPDDVAVNYPPALPDVRLKKPVDILFIQVESLRADALTAELMPLVTAIAKRPGCTTAVRHYSGGHTTEYGTFALLFGLNSYHFDPFSRSKTRITSWPLDVLKRNGYERIGASSSTLLEWNNAAFEVDQLDRYEEFLADGIVAGDKAVLAMFADYAEKRDASRPVFGFAFFGSTHHNYSYPPKFERFTPVMAEDYNHFLPDDELAASETLIRNRYKNSVGFIDHLIDRMVSLFSERLERGELALVITGDHGEEFWEHGLIGHAGMTFVEQRVRVPLVLCLPGGARISQTSSHVDLWPTIMRELGPEPAVDPQLWSDGRVLGQPADEPVVFVGGRDFPYVSQSALLVAGDRKHHVELCSTGALCLQPAFTTDLDDRGTALTGDVEAVTPLLEPLYTQMERFLTFPD